MLEGFKSAPVERTPLRKKYDEVGRALAPVSMGLGAIAIGAAAIAGSVVGVAAGGLYFFMDKTQRDERDRAPQDQSPWNTERILDWLGIGTKKANTRSALAAA